MKSTYKVTSIKRGDIFFVFPNGNAVGNEYRKGRPALVVSSQTQLDNSDYIQIVYLTSQPKKPLPTHFFINKDNVGLEKNSTALCENVVSIDKSRLANFLGALSEEDMKLIDAKLAIGLGLSYLIKPKDVSTKVVEKDLAKYKSCVETVKNILNCL